MKGIICIPESVNLAPYQYFTKYFGNIFKRKIFAIFSNEIFLQYFLNLDVINGFPLNHIELPLVPFNSP